MPTPELMTWVPKQKRWTKWYKGTTYSVSAHQLETEPTKEASLQAANEWWGKKQDEIDEKLGLAKKQPPHILIHYQTAVENHRVFAKWQRKYGKPTLAEKSETIMEWLKTALESDAPPFPLTQWQFDPLWDQWQDEGAFVLWAERKRQIDREEREETAVPKENTIRAHVDDYLDFRRSRVASGKNTLGTYDTYRGRLNVFRNWADPFAPLEAINEALWERFFTHLSKQVESHKMSRSTMSSTLGAAREFILSRWERKLIERPRNLNSRSLSISAPIQEVEILATDEVKVLLNAAREREKLYLLLMLNCGFYGVDIAMLKKSEYRKGRITRKRTKTRNRSEKVPTVDYLLWKETDTLLKKHLSDHSELCLLNENGQPLWKEQEGKKGGKFNRINNVKCAIFRLRQRTGQKKSLKYLRKTAASMLEGHLEYGRYAEYFLGEAPQSVTSRHYVRPSKEQFDAAIKWLGAELGIQ